MHFKKNLRFSKVYQPVFYNGLGYE